MQRDIETSQVNVHFQSLINPRMSRIIFFMPFGKKYARNPAYKIFLDTFTKTLAMYRIAAYIPAGDKNQALFAAYGVSTTPTPRHSIADVLSTTYSEQPRVVIAFPPRAIHYFLTTVLGYKGTYAAGSCYLVQFPPGKKPRIITPIAVDIG